MTAAMLDRGRSFGDGVFETLRVNGGQAPLREWHWRRLRIGAARLAIPFDERELNKKLDQALATAARAAVIKLMVSRGGAGRGYRVDPQAQGLLHCHSFPLVMPALEQRRDGLQLGLCQLRLAQQPLLAGIKHLNRLEQVLARREVDQAGWDEGMLLDQQGRVVELTAMNLFARFGQQWWTPDLSACGVAGVMREWLLSQQLGDFCGRQVRIDARPLSQLRVADELFACNSVAGILPVRKLGLWQWPLGRTSQLLQQRVDALFGAS